MRAIETEYKGYRFRSRLEARWAVFFDACGVKWEYEPEGFDLGDGIYYLPDFLLRNFFDNSDVDYTGSADLWIEVKGVMTKTDAEKILRFSGSKPILVVTNIPEGDDIWDIVQYVVDLSNDDDHFYANVHPFNLETIYGNNYGALPCVNKHGRFHIQGVGNARAMDDIDPKITERAYRLARQARFERNDQNFSKALLSAQKIIKSRKVFYELFGR